MGENSKKALFIIMLAILIVAGSFYSFWQKHSVNESVSTGEVLAKESKEEKISEVIVYISGAVTKPGVYKLPNHARAIELITAAGGFALEADVSKINLAQLLKDGMHIHVPAKAVDQGGGDAPSSSKARAGTKININTADKTELDRLPGVGPALAEGIMEYRQANGGFTDLEGLKKVPGIGSNKFEKMKDKITL